MNSGNNIPETENGKSVIRRDTGFTLIEVVVALLVLTIGLLGMAALAISVMQGNKSSNQISTATALAQDKMEEFRGLGYEGLPSSNSPPPENYGGIPNFPHYKRVVNLATKYLYSDDTVSETLNSTKVITTITRTVTVKVHWNPQDDTRNYVETKMLFSR